MIMIRGKRRIDRFLEALRQRGASPDAETERLVREILEAVRLHGDEAVRKYTAKYDRNSVARLAFTSAEVERYARMADRVVVRALEIAAGRIRKFHEMQAEESWSYTEQETILGQIIRPLSRVGVYIPGGKAAYPSTVLMNVIPAQVAGVREIAVCVPSPSGQVNPSVMAALKLLGVGEVYRIGGAQAVAAMAFGTRTVRPVDKIVGPGNRYVAAAKKMVFGVVDIDMIAGPSEILIIADASANPAFLAADLLSQAEHDEDASSVLITTSPDVARRTAEQVGVQLESLRRKEIARKSLERYGAIMVVKDLADAAALSNRIAPEHLEVMTRDPVLVLQGIESAGAIFLGPWTPEALGDYAAGPNHTLPTGGTARFSSPLGVYDFYKRSSILGFTKKGFLGLSRVVETIADVEGLEGHGNTVRIRRPNGRHQQGKRQGK